MERSIRTSCASAARLIVLAACLIVGAACQDSLSEPTERGAGQAAGETLVIGTTADLESVNPLTAYSTSVNSQVLFRMFLHLAEEELLIVLEGTAALRTPEGWDELAAGDVVSFPRGEEGELCIAGAGVTGRPQVGMADGVGPQANNRAMESGEDA